MLRCSEYRWPSGDEVVIHDPEAEQTVREMLEADAAGFDCSLTNARVSKLSDLKIVRFDLSRDKETVGLAMCIEKAGLNYLGVLID